jgi:hypothetical protein
MMQPSLASAFSLRVTTDDPEILMTATKPKG